MMKKKAIAGLLSAVLVVGGSASAFAASDGTGNALDKLTSKVSTFAAGTMKSGGEGKLQMNKEVIDESDTAELGVGVKTFEPGTKMSDGEGKQQMNKEVIEEGDAAEVSVDVKTFEPGTKMSDVEGKQQMNKEIIKK